jgi:2-oxoacid:acceptor oxidoreductase delta subunit (pyruvate/2-ketoisovalerate family)
MAKKLKIFSEAGSSLKEKTGSWRVIKPIIDRKRCIGCNICVQVCPDGCAKLDKKKKAVVNYNYCKGCGICSEECPVKCIAMVKEKK